MTQDHSPEKNARIGLGFALGSGFFWGIVPVYFKVVGEVPQLEILAHRVLWTFLLTLGILYFSGNIRRLRTLFSSMKTIGILMCTAVLILINWSTFVWAVAHDRVLETSLGYYITPLVSVLLGVLILRERLRPAQTVSVVIAAIGVLCLIIGHGSLPWICLVLPFSFGLYGLLKKHVGVDSLVGMAAEMGALLPMAGGYIIYLLVAGEGHYGVADGRLSLLIMLSGPVTLFPLGCFAAAANRIQLTTLSFVQYIAPSISFLLAITAFGEPFGTTEIVTFLLIWLSIGIYISDTLRASRADRPLIVVAEESA